MLNSYTTIACQLFLNGVLKFCSLLQRCDQQPRVDGKDWRHVRQQGPPATPKVLQEVDEEERETIPEEAQRIHTF